MAHPLELSYRWQPSVTIASVGLVVCVGIVLRSGAPGRWAVAAVLVVLWASLLAVVWLRTRAWLLVEGRRLTVRRYRRRHTVEADRLVHVRQFLTAHGPCYVLTTREPDGSQQRVVAPVALLRAGHSTLFSWILAEAPQAELDRGSTRTLEQLRIRGLVT
jgi:cell division protein FtsW (lipid II flippase)